MTTVFFFFINQQVFVDDNHLDRVKQLAIETISVYNYINHFNLFTTVTRLIDSMRQL